MKRKLKEESTEKTSEKSNIMKKNDDFDTKEEIREFTEIECGNVVSGETLDHKKKPIAPFFTKESKKKLDIRCFPQSFSQIPKKKTK